MRPATMPSIANGATGTDAHREYRSESALAQYVCHLVHLRSGEVAHGMRRKKAADVIGRKRCEEDAADRIHEAEHGFECDHREQRNQRSRKHGKARRRIRRHDDKRRPPIAAERIRPVEDAVCRQVVPQRRVPPDRSQACNRQHDQRELAPRRSRRVRCTRVIVPTGTGRTVHLGMESRCPGNCRRPRSGFRVGRSEGAVRSAGDVNQA